MGTLDSIPSIPKDDSHSAGMGVAGIGVAGMGVAGMGVAGIGLAGGGLAPGKGMHSALSTGTSLETKHSKMFIIIIIRLICT